MNTTMAAAAMANLQTLRPLPSPFSIHDRFYTTTTIPKTRINSNSYPNSSNNKSIRFPVISCCLNSASTSTTTITSSSSSSSSSSPDETSSPPPPHKELLPPVQKKRRPYRKLLPGEAEGITEEMRFVAMRLRDKKLKVINEKSDKSDTEEDDAGSGNSDGEIDDDTGNLDINEAVDLWDPDLLGFLRYLVDSELLHSSIERLVDESQDVSFAYFRKTGLERSESFRKDIEVFRQDNVVIPVPLPPAKKYVKYLEELAVESPPSFFCHLYNIYFAHIAGGQVIAKQVSERLLADRELEICKWPGDPEVLLKGMREKLNALGQHWSREVKSKCLREAAKSYTYMGAIIRLLVCK